MGRTTALATAAVAWLAGACDGAAVLGGGDDSGDDDGDDASGDDDAGDDRHRTFFTMIPTPRIYARFPFFTPMNVEDVFASLLLRPRPAVTARLDARRLRLSESADLWYAGGGAFEHGSFGYAGRPANGARGLASLYDLSVDWRLTPRWTVAAYAARAGGGPVVERIWPAHRTAHFGYVEMQYAR